MFSTCPPPVIHLYSTCNPPVLHLYSTCLHLPPPASYTSTYASTSHHLPSTCLPLILHLFFTCLSHTFHLSLPVINCPTNSLLFHLSSTCHFFFILLLRLSPPFPFIRSLLKEAEILHLILHNPTTDRSRVLRKTIYRKQLGRGNKGKK